LGCTLLVQKLMRAMRNVAQYLRSLYRRPIKKLHTTRHFPGNRDHAAHISTGGTRIAE
jgi:hypothetical protein